MRLREFPACLSHPEDGTTAVQQYMCNQTTCVAGRRLCKLLQMVAHQWPHMPCRLSR